VGSHTVHRHEPPVTAEPIKIIHETDEILVVNKPGSIPIHPTGRFRHNTVVFILAAEKGYTKLHLVHRLDRLTSGLLLLAKTSECANRIAQQIKSSNVRKEYIAKVIGNFPECCCP
jgi:tRNA pseudouridine synthase 8/2,5-diamino-6-(5-phospho-D-ribitylamino)-pyrimidin-4(3H)-one deaminase